MKLWVLGSGSAGNAVLVECGESRVLVDAGFGTRELSGRLRSIGVAPESIEACVVTHEHTDHMKGAAAGAKRWGWTLFASAGTIAACPELHESSCVAVLPGDSVSLARLVMTAYATPHDAAGPIGVRLACLESGVTAAVCTDVGHVSASVRALCAGADLLVGRRASLDRWLSLTPGRYRYLHIAAHAEVNDRYPAQTRVLLSGGTLDLARIRSLELRADLVTLSACESALGLRVRGEGVIGLPHAFLSAGASAVLVTLWRVDDRATALFMEEFYREMHGGAPPAAALQAVRHRWMTRLPRAHPAFWAPFVLVGA